MLFVICRWPVVCANEEKLSWSQYQKLHTLQMALIINKNLDKYMYLSVYGLNDNRVFENDTTKVKRTYDTKQCLRDLGQIRDAFGNENDSWATESKTFLREKKL